jgi:hypothetical protein
LAFIELSTPRKGKEVATIDIPDSAVPYIRSALHKALSSSIQAIENAQREKDSQTLYLEWHWFNDTVDALRKLPKELVPHSDLLDHEFDLFGNEEIPGE